MSEVIVKLIADWGYLGVFLLMVAENIFPPIPSELIMPFAGYVAARGELHVAMVLAAGTLGSLVGTSAWYLAARLLGLSRFIGLCNRLGRFSALNGDDIDDAQRWFSRHGALAVLIGRLLPAIRTLISVPAGLAAMPFWRFLGFSALGTLVWTGLLTGAGLLLHENYRTVEAWVDPVSTGIVVVVIALYFWRVVSWKPIGGIG